MIKKLTNIPDDFCPAIVTYRLETWQWIVIGLAFVATIVCLNEIAFRIRNRKPKEG